ncbi:MAG: DUF4783 domain-containing protein [Bacteroidota bacterium]
MKKNSLRLVAVIIPAFLWMGFISSQGPEETATLVASAIQASNATDISKYFNSMVDLTLPGYDDSYSKAQAGQIMKEFFSQNPVKSFKINRQGSSSDGSHYSIGSLDTGKKVFRVYFLLKSVNGQNLIQQLQVQDN